MIYVIAAVAIIWPPLFCVEVWLRSQLCVKFNESHGLFSKQSPVVIYARQPLGRALLWLQPQLAHQRDQQFDMFGQRIGQITRTAALLCLAFMI